MALYMFMGKYTPSAMKAIIDTGSNREAAARQAVEAAGNKLIGFYGMFGQDYNIAMIVAVSYTHLDVYKRQMQRHARLTMRRHWIPAVRTALQSHRWRH